MTAFTSPELTEALSAYEVEGEIGRGSWGVVLKARHRQLGREVAIKQLPYEFAAQSDVRRRFVNEARLLASLDHPHIVPVYDFIEKEGVCLLIMEFLPGGTVWKRFNAEGFDYVDSLAIALATCAALHFAHRHGVLHRDIKPENLMFSAGGILKVTDFGIAKVLGAASTMGTRAGEVLGSPAYIAPEQATGSELGPFTDVYATAVVLYELLSGRLPFPDDGDPLMVMYRHVHEQPRPLLEVAPEVPEPIARVVMYGLATRPQARYQTAEEFGVALAEAATASFGPGWLGRSSVSVMGGGPIIAATERPASPGKDLAPRLPAPGEERLTEKGVPALASAPGAGSGPGPVSGPPGHPVASGPSQGVAGPEIVGIGGTGAAHPGGVAGRPASDAYRPAIRKTTSISLIGASMLALLAIALAFLGPSRTVSPESLPQSDRPVLIQAVPVGRDVAHLDFDRPVDVKIQSPPGRPDRPPAGEPPAGGTSRLVATVRLPGGISVPVNSQLGIVEDGGTVYVFEGRQFKYLVAGTTRIDFHVEPVREAQATGPQSQARFAVRVAPTNKTFFAIPTLGAGLGLLAVLAYAEALLIPLRRGKKGVGSIVGLGLLGSLAGLTVGVLGWALGSVDPEPLLTFVGALMMGLAGVGTGIWAYFSAPGRPGLVVTESEGVA